MCLPGTWLQWSSSTASLPLCSACSCRQLSSSLTWWWCARYVDEHPTPTVSDFNHITSQPRPTLPCRRSCCWPLRSSTFFCAARHLSSTWSTTGLWCLTLTFAPTISFCFNSICSLPPCLFLSSPTTSTSIWLRAKSFVRKCASFFVVVVFLPLDLLMAMLLNVQDMHVKLQLLSAGLRVQCELHKIFDCSDVCKLKHWVFLLHTSLV